MAKKAKVNKTQAVRDYLQDHPEALSSEIAAALTKQGIKIAPGYVANIKVALKKKSTKKTSAAKKPAKNKALAEAAVPAVVEKPAKSADTITLEQVRKVAETVSRMGGFYRVSEVLDVIRELGGVKKFRDLAEAMSATGIDDIPF